jgi:hypothetical protein
MDFGTLLALQQYFLKLFRKYELKKELKKEFENSFEDISLSYRKFFNCISTIYGSIIISIFFPPQIDPEKHAYEIVKELNDSYNDLLRSCSKVIRLIKIHELEIRKIMNDKDMLVIEILLEGFKDDKVDFDFIINNRLIQNKVLSKSKVENKFSKVLNKKIKEFNEKEGLNIISDGVGNVKHNALIILNEMLKNPRKIPENFDKMRKAIKR